MFKLSIWILEDYGTNIWTLKHIVSTLKVFGKTNIEFAYFDVDESYSAVTVHLEWNLLLFVGVGEERAIIAYNMDNRKVHVIPTHYIQYGRHGLLPEFICRPYYLPYVSLFSESLAKE
jgi:hypothetical protein